MASSGSISRRSGGLSSEQQIPVKRIGQTRIEWALLGVIAAVCGLLSFLQYRWTGELSRAEPALLRSGLNDELRRLSQAFNEEIREDCAPLLPDARELREAGSAEAHRVRYEQWAASHDPSLFARIGVAVPEQGVLRLYSINGEGRIAPMEWPSKWNELREAMTARSKGVGRPPNTPPDSSTIQLPVFADPVDRSSELEWMIFDLNEDYLRTKVFPRLVGEYLNPAGSADYDVSVSSGGPHGPVIFSTRSDGASVLEGADAAGEDASTTRHGSRAGPSPCGIATGRWISPSRAPAPAIFSRH